MNHTDLIISCNVYDVIKEHLAEGFRRASKTETDQDRSSPST
jgi:hypothetical protein